MGTVSDVCGTSLLQSLSKLLSADISRYEISWNPAGSHAEGIKARAPLIGSLCTGNSVN